MKQKKKKFIIFCHIGKTAGTTIHYILSNNKLCYFTLNAEKKWGNDIPFNDHSLSKLLKIGFGQISGIGGHVLQPHFDYLNVLSKKNYSPFMFTFLRNPIERYISELNHVILKLGKSWSFDDFVKIERHRNVQTKCITGSANADRAIEIIKEKFSFVGLTERFDEGLLLMKSLFPGVLDVNYEKKNVINRSIKPYTVKKLSNEQLQMVVEANSEDLKLYDFIENEFYPFLLNQYTGDIKEDLDKFGIVNQEYKFKVQIIFWHKAKNQIAKMVLQPLTRI